MSVSFFSLALLALPVAALLLWTASRRASAPPPSNPSRLSRLCAVAFLFGMLAALFELAALLAAEAAAYPNLLGLYGRDARVSLQAAEVLRLAALAPGLAALAFAIAGRGAVRESGGALRGRSLYRAAALMGLCAFVLAWSSLSAAGFTVARPAGP